MGSTIDARVPYDYPFDLCDMDRLKEECRQTIDAMIAAKERELQTKTQQLNELLSAGEKPCTTKNTTI